jgi:hypothetical protein
LQRGRRNVALELQRPSIGRCAGKCLERWRCAGERWTSVADRRRAARTGVRGPGGDAAPPSDSRHAAERPSTESHVDRAERL